MPWRQLQDENRQNRNAGNGGDLGKHTVYLTVLDYLLAHSPWSTKLRVRECHAGRGMYRIPADDARRPLLECLYNPLGADAGVLLHDVGKFPTYEEADRIRFNLHDKVGAEIADTICRRLNFSNADRSQIVQLVERHMKFLHIRDMRQAKLRRFLASPTIEEDLELHRIDCLASHADLENYDFCREKLEEFSREEEELIPPPLITGDDLIAEGYQPGPQFKEILNTVAEAQLEGTLKSKEEALKFVRQKYPLKG